MWIGGGARVARGEPQELGVRRWNCGTKPELAILDPDRRHQKLNQRSKSHEHEV